MTALRVKARRHRSIHVHEGAPWTANKGRARGEAGHRCRFRVIVSRVVIAMADDGVQRARLLDVLAEIVPADALEREHLEATRAWTGSGAEVYRREAIDVPSTHLVVYFVPLDSGGNAAGGQILLVAHRKAGLWLPAGGHVEPGEDPWDTVARECEEELHVPAVPHPGTSHTGVPEREPDPPRTGPHRRRPVVPPGRRPEADHQLRQLRVHRRALVAPGHPAGTVGHSGGCGLQPHLGRFLDKLTSLQITRQ